MDSLKTLMDKKEYELVLKITAATEDPTSMFYRISALIALGRAQEGLDCLLENRITLESNMALLIKVHFELLFILQLFDEAYAEINYYQNLPYVSQEVEEILKDLPKLVRDEEKRAFNSKNYTEQQIIKLLSSDDQANVIAGIDIVRDRDVMQFLPSIQDILLNFPKQSIRSFALLLLVQKQVNQTFQFNHMEEIIEVNPTKLEPPFVGSSFNNLVKKLDKDFRDPALSQNATQLLSSYIIYIYPDKIPFEDPVTSEALYQISCAYLQCPPSASLESRCLAKGLNPSKVEDAIHLIKEAVEDF